MNLEFWQAHYARMHLRRGGGLFEYSSVIQMVIGQFNEALPDPPIRDLRQSL